MKPNEADMERLDKLLKLCKKLIDAEHELRLMGDVIAANAIGRALFFIGRAMGREIIGAR